MFVCKKTSSFTELAVCKTLALDMQSKKRQCNAYDTLTEMTSITYGTLQDDASPSSPKSYRLSKVAKIALALIACGAAAIAHPGTRQATTSFTMDSSMYDGMPDRWQRKRSARNPQDGEPTLDEAVEFLQARVAAIEKYLQATGGSGGSGNSRGSVMMPGGLGAMARGHGARRRLRGA